MSKVKASKGGPKPQPPSTLRKGSSSALGNPSFRRASQVMSRSIMESKARLHNPSRAPRRKDEEGFRDEYDDADGDWGGPKELIRPEDQIELDEKELKEEFTRVLTADNPHAPANIVRYNFKDKLFKQVAAIDQLAIHFAMESNLLHKDSDEAQRQLNKDADQSDESEVEDDGEEEERPESGDKQSGGEQKQLRNQFNYSERASQTLNNPFRDRGTATEPPPRADFSVNANQMEIFDAYVDDLVKQDKAKEKKGKGEEVKKETKTTNLEISSDDITRVKTAAKIMERMVNQNTFDEIAQDFKYYDDPGDQFRENVGSMLPLWRFKFDKARKAAITALSWNPLYSDLFAVGRGSYEFTDQGSGGLICFHSLKNPTYPEYIFETPSGVMCLDIHPEHPYLVAAGLYDGTVLVYDLQENSKEAIYKATANTGKHSDPVWQVSWQKNDMDGNLNFYSVSADGRVVTWKLVKNELQFQDALTLKNSLEGQKDFTLSSGTAIGFSPFVDHLFLVGSEEGQIYKCSKAYTTHYLDVYKAHHMAVHSISWNPFHQNVFASCGADWTVKIWDHTRKNPMFSFDLNNVVGDVAWAPYCSTVFAAVTAGGKAYVFDLSINKYEPLCVQSVIQKKRTKLTHVCFNPVYPILIIGDDRGTVICLKLSPNLRKNLTEKNRTKDTEVARIEKLISFVREPLLEKQREN